MSTVEKVKHQSFSKNGNKINIFEININYKIAFVIPMKNCEYINSMNYDEYYKLITDRRNKYVFINYVPFEIKDRLRNALKQSCSEIRKSHGIDMESGPIYFKKGPFGSICGEELYEIKTVIMEGLRYTTTWMCGNSLRMRINKILIYHSDIESHVHFVIDTLCTMNTFSNDLTIDFAKLERIRLEKSKPHGIEEVKGKYKKFISDINIKKQINGKDIVIDI